MRFRITMRFLLYTITAFNTLIWTVIIYMLSTESDLHLDIQLFTPRDAPVAPIPLLSPLVSCHLGDIYRNITRIGYLTRDQREVALKAWRSSNRQNLIGMKSCLQFERKELLKTHCMQSQQKRFTTKFYEHMFFDRKHNLLLCLPPNTGSNTFKVILANNSESNPLPKNFEFELSNFYGIDIKSNYYGIERLDQLKSKERKDILISKNYTRIMLTRHPFERIYSVYRQKIKSGLNPTMREIHGSRILNMIYPEMSDLAKKTGRDVSFWDFIKYIQNPISFEDSHGHWDSVASICQPCHIDYDYIVKTETMDEDIINIVQSPLMKPYYRGVGTAVNVMVRNSKRTLSETGFPLNEFKHLDRWDVEKLVEMFQKDFLFFGYTSAVCLENKIATMHSSCIHGSLRNMCC